MLEFIMQKLALWIVGFFISDMRNRFGNQRPNFNSHILEFYKREYKGVKWLYHLIKLCQSDLASNMLIMVTTYKKKEILKKLKGI